MRLVLQPGKPLPVPLQPRGDRRQRAPQLAGPPVERLGLVDLLAGQARLTEQGVRLALQGFTTASRLHQRLLLVQLPLFTLGCGLQLLGELACRRCSSRAASRCRSSRPGPC